MFNLHLPTIEIIAGDTCPFTFQVQDMLHLDVTTGNCSACLSISTYVNDSSDPIKVFTQDNIASGALTFEISPADTIDLRGKYVYQLYLSNGNKSEIYGGHLIVYENRNKSVIAGQEN